MASTKLKKSKRKISNPLFTVDVFQCLIFDSSNCGALIKVTEYVKRIASHTQHAGIHF